MNFVLGSRNGRVTRWLAALVAIGVSVTLSSACGSSGPTSSSARAHRGGDRSLGSATGGGAGSARAGERHADPDRHQGGQPPRHAAIPAAQYEIHPSSSRRVILVLYIRT